MLQIAWKHQNNGHRRRCENSHWQISAPDNKTGWKFISKLALNNSWNLPHFMMSSLFFQYFTGLWQLQMTLSLILADILGTCFCRIIKLFLLILSNLADLMGPFFYMNCFVRLIPFLCLRKQLNYQHNQLFPSCSLARTVLQIVTLILSTMQLQ